MSSAVGGPSKGDLVLLSAFSSLVGALTLAIFLAMLVFASGQPFGLSVLAVIFFTVVTGVIIFPLWLFVFLPLALLVPSRSLLWKPYVMPFCGLITAPLCFILLGTLLPLVKVDPAGRFGTVEFLPAIVGITTCLTASLLHQRLVKTTSVPMVDVSLPVINGEPSRLKLIFLSLKATFAGFLGYIIMLAIVSILYLISNREFESLGIEGMGGVAVFSALPGSLIVFALGIEFLVVWIVVLMPLALCVPTRSVLWNPSTLTCCGLLAGATISVVSLALSSSGGVGQVIFTAVTGGVICLTGAHFHKRLLEEKIS